MQQVQKNHKMRKFVYIVLINLITLLLLNACSNLGYQHRTQPLPATVNPVQVKNIALLLPLSGNYTKTTSAIKNGFLASYYNYNTNHPNNTINLKVIDTNNKNIVDVYREVVSIGADVVVGPLMKQDVEALTNAFGAEMPIPTIALNTLDNYKHKTTINLYQFGLLPQDEAEQVANKMLQDNYKNIAIMIPSPTNWSNNIATVFQQEYTQLGGKIIETFSYNLDNGDIDLKVKEFFHANKEKTSEHDSQNVTINYRNDIEAVFLVADSKTARKITPFIKFYTNNTLPIYAISSVYDGFVQPNLDIDLDDVRFCDMPWTIANPINLEASLQTMKQNLQFSVSDMQQNLNRLYALGVDSCNLAINISSLINTRKANFVGATGMLWLDNYNHVNRQLMWTDFKNGIPQSI